MFLMLIWGLVIVFLFSEERFKRLVEKFKEEFKGTQPQFLCRAPGRVNLIGNIYREIFVFEFSIIS
jgi:galactokinase